jgi:hypothetical protein
MPMTNYQELKESRRLVLVARTQCLSRTDVGSIQERAAWDVYQCEATRHERMHGEYYGGVRADAWRRVSDHEPLA